MSATAYFAFGFFMFSNANSAQWKLSKSGNANSDTACTAKPKRALPACKLLFELGFITRKCRFLVIKSAIGQQFGELAADVQTPDGRRMDENLVQIRQPIDLRFQFPQAGKNEQPPQAARDFMGRTLGRVEEVLARRCRRGRSARDRL